MSLANHIRWNNLEVWSAKDGRYVAVDKNKLTDAQIRAALTNGRNNGAVDPRSGWSVNANGQIYRTAQAPGTTTTSPAATPGAATPTNTETPATATPPPPPPPARDQFSGYRDSDYWTGLANLRNEMGLIQNPDGSLVHQGSQSRLAQLGQRIDPLTFKPVAGGVGGKTLYDILYEQQQQADLRNKTASRSQAAQRGVLSSGHINRQLTQLAGQSAAATDGLVRQYGTDLNDSRSAAYQASQEQAAALARFNQAQANLATAATDRGYQQALGGYQQTYGGY